METSGQETPPAIVRKYLHERREEMEELHEAFAVENPQDAGKSRSNRVAWEKSHDFMTTFQKFSNYLDQVSRDRSVDFGQDVKDCKWSDALEKLQEANEAVATRFKRDKTFLSKGARVLTNMSNMFQPGLQAIPDELCILHGGLALLFHLAKGREKVKQDIVKVFEDLTYTIAVAGMASESYPDDPRLCDALDRLRITLCKKIPRLIGILIPDSIIRRATVAFQAHPAETVLESIQTDAKRVEMRAKSLTDRLDNEAAKLTKEHVEEIHDGVRGLHEQVHEMDAMQQDIFDMVNFALAGQDGMVKMLCDVVEIFKYHMGEESPVWPARTASGAATAAAAGSSIAPDTNLSTLQWILDVDRAHESRDLNYVRRQEQEFDARSKSAVAEIFLSPNFQRWMTADSSDLLYIEGHFERHSGKTTPISYFCAQLVHRLKSQPRMTTSTLHFFCGQHVASNDQLRGPRGLMRSLIAQCLRIWPNVSLAELDLSAFSGRHDVIPMEELCSLFQIIVGQMRPHSTVVCVIDDVLRLEKDEWTDEYWLLMGMLENLVKGGDAGLMFKVMMTSPGPSKWLRGETEVQPDHRIKVTDNGIPVTARGRAWD